MAVKIRFSRTGKKHIPFYSIVAVDSRKKRDGAVLEDLGTYDPLKGKIVTFHEERVNYWLSVGAVPTDVVKRVHKIFKKSSVGTEAAESKPAKAAKSAAKKSKKTETPSA